jgi:uncharacterized protein YaeQ
MALKATIFKARLQLADMDRAVYADHDVTMARHPSETDERMMARLLALALNLPATANHGALEFAKGLWDPDEPDRALDRGRPARRQAPDEGQRAR